jgi:hypothetical protein
LLLKPLLLSLLLLLLLLLSLLLVLLRLLLLVVIVLGGESQIGGERDRRDDDDDSDDDDAERGAAEDDGDGESKTAVAAAGHEEGVNDKVGCGRGTDDDDGGEGGEIIVRIDIRRRTEDGGDRGYPRPDVASVADVVVNVVVDDDGDDDLLDLDATTGVGSGDRIIGEEDLVNLDDVVVAGVVGAGVAVAANIVAVVVIAPDDVDGAFIDLLGLGDMGIGSLCSVFLCVRPAAGSGSTKSSISFDFFNCLPKLDVGTANSCSSRAYIDRHFLFRLRLIGTCGGRGSIGGGGGGGGGTRRTGAVTTGEGGDGGTSGM